MIPKDRKLWITVALFLEDEKIGIVSADKEREPSMIRAKARVGDYPLICCEMLQNDMAVEKIRLTNWLLRNGITPEKVPDYLHALYIAFSGMVQDQQNKQSQPVMTTKWRIIYCITNGFACAFTAWMFLAILNCTAISPWAEIVTGLLGVVSGWYITSSHYPGYRRRHHEHC